MSTRNELTGHVDMTMAEWKKLQTDFKSVRRTPDGKLYRTCLSLNPKAGATELWPVNIIKQTK
jgi:hypothetical protein